MREDNISIFLETRRLSKSSIRFPEYQKAIYIPETEVHSIVDCQRNIASKIEAMSTNIISVSTDDSFSAAIRLKQEYLPDCDNRVLVLNFANSVQPGGGVCNGARAQEEDLCRKSSLYESLISDSAMPFYDNHADRYSPLASDAMILSPTVDILRDRRNSILEKPVTVSILTCAAPIAYSVRMSREKYSEILYRRIEGIASVAAQYGYQRLVLGAFGCGFFGNDPHQVASMFKDVFDSNYYADCIRIDYAILCKPDSPSANYLAFRETYE